MTESAVTPAVVLADAEALREHLDALNEHGVTPLAVGIDAWANGKRAAQDAVDDRETHPTHFAEFEAEFGPFTLDVAAASHNAKCERYYTLEDDGLMQPWSGVVWCNPPYSALGAWVEKAWREWRRGEVERIVMLLPANRTEQTWWQRHVENNRSDASPLTVRFLPGRMRFIRPNAVIGPKGDRPPFGCCLLIWRGDAS